MMMMVMMLPIIMTMMMKIVLPSKDSAALHCEWTQEAERPLRPLANARGIKIMMRMMMMIIIMRMIMIMIKIIMRMIMIMANARDTGWFLNWSAQFSVPK